MKMWDAMGNKISYINTDKNGQQIKRKRWSHLTRKMIWTAHDCKCAYCGTPVTFTDMQLDHKESLYNGGEDNIKNLVCSCRACNKYKGAMDTETFRQELSKLPERLMRDSSTFRLAVRHGLVTVNSVPVTFAFEKGGSDE